MIHCQQQEDTLACQAFSMLRENLLSPRPFGEAGSSPMALPDVKVNTARRFFMPEEHNCHVKGVLHQVTTEDKYAHGTKCARSQEALGFQTGVLRLTRPKSFPEEKKKKKSITALLSQAASFCKV